jgi:acetyl-CoA carboxylase biotin carboxyl carrier protein
MDMRSIKRLIALLDQSGLVEIEIKNAVGSVRISRTPDDTAAQPLHYTKHRSGDNSAVLATPRAYVARPLAAKVKLPGTASRPQAHTAIATLDPNEHVITAPIVGTFYGSPIPGATPFVRVGDAIARGQVLCIIEAMKLTHAVESDRPGRVMWILARSGEPVEFAQPLFVLQ